MCTHTHTHRGNSAHDWGELSPWTWTGGPWGASSPILVIWALLATLTQVLKQGVPSQPKVPIPTTNSSKDWPVAGYMGRGLPQLSPSKRLSTHPLASQLLAAWSLPIKEFQNYIRNIRREVRCQSGISRWDCGRQPSRGGFWWAVGAQGLAPHWTP